VSNAIICDVYVGVPLCLSDSRRVACVCSGGPSRCVMRLYVCIAALWWLLNTIREPVAIVKGSLAGPL